jgi:hypothetical protein
MKIAIANFLTAVTLLRQQLNLADLISIRTMTQKLQNSGSKYSILLFVFLALQPTVVVFSQPSSGL